MTTVKFTFPIETLKAAKVVLAQVPGFSGEWFNTTSTQVVYDETDAAAKSEAEELVLRMRSAIDAYELGWYSLKANAQ